ncbi:MAG TPA: magnesium transporter CorA family protein [Candidatus Peribacteraceae bacterium]|nr:magnesium transporter CorA family protein [Candidatus Peribacteraceae bacterium]
MRSLEYQGITWHDDPKPTEDALRELKKKYNFHELDIEDCLSENERPKVEEYEDYVFLVFHIPYMSVQSGRVLKEEVNIFVGQSYIVTLHEGKIPVLDSLWKELEESRAKRHEFLAQGTGFFLYELMSRLFDGIFPIVDQMTKELRRLEVTLFESEEEVNLLRDIMTLKRNTITMRSILLPQRTIIATLEHKSKKFVSKDLALYFDDILDAIERQWTLLETAKEMSEALQDTHEAWLTHRTNAVVRVLTAFSVTMLPLTVITGLYGMNVKLPYGETPWIFEWILLAMAAVVAGLLIYFARKRWL